MNDADFVTVALSVVPAPGQRKQWVHYLPNGRFASRDGRAYRLDDAQAFAAQSFRYSAGQPIPVDFDHALEAAATDRTPAPAAGWISELSAKPDGVWGLTEWTPRAAAHLEAKEYRFVSPVFFHTKDLAAVALKAAALTNQPALNLTAVCSTGRPMDLDQLCAALRPLLGLSDSAMPDAIVEATRQLTSRVSAASAAPAADQFVPMAEFERVVAALNVQNRGVSAQAAELAVNDAIERGKLMPALRDWGLSICSENKPAFDAFLQRTSGGMQTLFSRPLAGAKLPASGKGVSDIEREIAAKMGHSPDELI